MEIYDGSGEPFIETEEDQAFLDLLTEFYFSNQDRYKEQARKLLREGLLLVPFGDSILKYSLNDGCARFKVSRDRGCTFSSSLQVTPLPWRRKAKIERIIDQFAHSEAREILGI